MIKCKCCGQEEIGYGTLLDKRGYCYKPSCQSCSYDEVEQQNTRLQSELDKQIKDNRKLVLGLKMVTYMTPKAEEIALQQAIKITRDVLKEVGEEV